MSTKTIELKQLQITVSELISLIQVDREIVITNDNTPVAKLILLNPADRITSDSEKTPKPGLNLGAMTMSNDFNQPLSDEFWLQNS